MDKKILLNMLCIMLVTAINDCCGDLAFKYFVSNVQQFFKKAPKALHSYIRMFLYRYLKGNELQSMILNKAVFNNYKYSITFLELRDKSLKSRGMLEILYTVNVSWTSGMISISLPSYKIGSKSFKYYFNLSPVIRLNLTFVLLHLRDVLINCQYDKLEVENLMQTESKYKYCGYHTNFNLYPDMHIFFVTITLTLRKPFDLKAIFSVTDNKLIVNPLDEPNNEKRIFFFIHFLCYEVAREYYLRSFLVSTVKIYKVQIYIVNPQENNYVIYDGPGYRFDILNKRGGKFHFVASTFQCLLQFLLPYMFQGDISDLFHYWFV